MNEIEEDWYEEQWVTSLMGAWDELSGACMG